MYSSFSVGDTFKVGDYVKLFLLCGVLAETVVTGRKVNQRAAKRRRDFPHQEQEKQVFPVQLVIDEWERVYSYITYDMNFRFVPSDPVCFDKLSRCH